MSLYDLNKSVISQLPDYGEKEFINAINTIDDFVSNDKFYMLLGREVNYYTIFMREPNAQETIGEAVVDCLKYFSPAIKSIDVTEDKSAIEVWAMNADTPVVMYFFPYNEGVVICK